VKKHFPSLAEQFDVHANRITQWKSPLLEGAAGVFGEAKAEAATRCGGLQSVARQDRRADAGERFLEGALTKAGLPSAKR
jgi:transposase